MHWKFTAAELAKCAHRELSKRQGFYSKLVREGCMKEQDATREIDMMGEIAARFEALDQRQNPRPEEPVQTDLIGE